MQTSIFNNNNNIVTTSTTVTTSSENQQVSGSRQDDKSLRPPTTGFKLMCIHASNVEKCVSLRQLTPPKTVYIRVNDEIGNKMLREMSERNHTLKKLVDSLDLDVEPDSHIYYEVAIPETFSNEVQKRKLKLLLNEWWDKRLIYLSNHIRLIGTEVMR